jgi:hypothetical protein
MSWRRDHRDRPERLASLFTAMIGMGICGLIGPLLPLLVTIPVNAFRERLSVRDAMSALAVLPYVWPVAVIFMGPAGAILGAFGAMWIRLRSRTQNSRRLLLETGLAGLVLGTIVPLSMVLLFLFQGSRPDWGSLKTFIVMGGSSGIASAVLVFLTMRRFSLLTQN